MIYAVIANRFVSMILGSSLWDGLRTKRECLMSLGTEALLTSNIVSFSGRDCWQSDIPLYQGLSHLIGHYICPLRAFAVYFSVCLISWPISNTTGSVLENISPGRVYIQTLFVEPMPSFEMGFKQKISLVVFIGLIRCHSDLGWLHITMIKITM